MPFLAGSISVRTYSVSEPAADGYLAPFTKALQRYAFQPIDDRKGQTQAAGWVNIRNMLDNRLEPESWHFPPYIVLGFRVDRKTVPAALLRARVEDAARRTLRQERRPRLSKDEKAALEANIRSELLSQSLPSTSLTEVAWNLETNRLYVASTATGANDMVATLFGETFERAVIPHLPYLVAEEWAENHNCMRALEGSYSSDFGQLHRQHRTERRHGVQVLQQEAAS